MSADGITQAEHISHVSPCPKGFIVFVNGFKYKPHHKLLEIP